MNAIHSHHFDTYYTVPVHEYTMYATQVLIYFMLPMDAPCCKIMHNVVQECTMFHKDTIYVAQGSMHYVPRSAQAMGMANITLDYR